MNILYLSRLAFDSQKANVYNTVQTCAALAKAGAKVVLVSSDNGASTEAQLSAFRARYNLDDSFEIVSLDGKSNKSRSKLAVIRSNFELMGVALQRRNTYDCVYVRDARVAIAAFFCAWILRKPVFFEAHAVLVGARNKFLGDLLARSSRGVIAITHALAEYFKRLNPNTIVSYCAAAEPERFAKVTQTKAQLRAALTLPEDKYILCYTGNLSKTGNNDSYGVEDIIAAMPYLPTDTIFVGVGKVANETAELEALASELGVAERVRFLPWVSKDEVARYVLASDVLLIPAAGARIGNAPTKMFDYLISGVPIVAADTVPIREVLSDRTTALLVEYKKPQAWASAINEIKRDPSLRESLVTNAKHEGSQFTWEKRGRDILSFLEHSV